MWHALLASVSLTVAAVSLALGTVKALAARREPALVLKLTASSLFHSAALFLLVTPAVYHAVGELTGVPHLAALLIDCAALLRVGHAHLLAHLWHPPDHGGVPLRRTVRAWAPLYGGTLVVLAALFALTDFDGPARPLLLATDHARVPQIVALHVLYFLALSTAVTATVLKCRSLLALAAPGLTPELDRSVRGFAVAVALDLVHAVCLLVAMAGAAHGRGLDALAEGAWLTTAASALVATHSLVRLSVHARRQERRDYFALRPLWQTVVCGDPRLVLTPGLAWDRWDTRIALSRRLVEIRDGARGLRPWMTAAPAHAVAQLARGGAHPGVDVVAAQAAATLLHAAGRRGAGRPPAPADSGFPGLPGEDVPAAGERAHLVLVARYLDHPIVQEALTLPCRRPRAMCESGHG
ncbi:MAB_1171c family putative transporter [Streptomyces sp. NPDC047071]|uniref:MAB_1171c family putative transporter n=1 Tax=Streptomyces sp. NPDC047071 TaxID=3154808 RepID=UPI003456EF4D